MDEVNGVVQGEYDYSKLKGDTGPLVYGLPAVTLVLLLHGITQTRPPPPFTSYPAGFVYFFMGLFYATDQGRQIAWAQYYFVAFYLIVFGLVAIIYIKTKAFVNSQGPAFNGSQPRIPALLPLRTHAHTRCRPISSFLCR